MSNYSDQIPSIEIIGNEIVIKINKDDLAFVAEHKPDSNYKIIDKDKFLEEFKFQLEEYSRSNATELGISELQYLFDQIIDEIYVNAGDSIVEEPNQ